MINPFVLRDKKKNKFIFISDIDFNINNELVLYKDNHIPVTIIKSREHLKVFNEKYEMSRFLKMAVCGAIGSKFSNYSDNF